MTILTTTRRTVSRKTDLCPRCAAVCKRHSTARRTLYNIGGILVVTSSKHYCKRCDKFFSTNMEHIAPKRGCYTWRVILAAVDLVVHQGMTLERAAARMLEKHHVHVPPTTLHDWVVEEVSDRIFSTERRTAYGIEARTSQLNEASPRRPQCLSPIGAGNLEEQT